MDPKQKLVEVVRSMMSELETDVNRRNAYINRRYGVVYNGDIMQGLRIKSGSDRTPYNYLPRVIDVHSSQLMGRLPQITTRFDTEDTSIYDLGQTGAQPDQNAQGEKEKAQLRNRQRAAAAELRTAAIRGIQRDNKWEEVAPRASTIASWSGFSVVKGWLDRTAKTYRFSVIETPQNFARYWSNSNFREHEADMYMYQISASRAKREYGKYLDENDDFVYSSPGYAWQRNPEAQDFDKLTIKKCWVIDATGYFPGVSTDGNGNLTIVDEGKETEISVKLVGDKVTQVVDKDVPKYYVIPNLEQAGNPWGLSDISDELIAVNQTMIETMSDWRTATWKITFPKYKGIGFDEADVMTLAERTAQVLPLGEGQDLVPLGADNQIQEFPRLMTQLWDSFTKLAKVSRVMLDDPTINPASNAGLMTTMKPLIDVTEDKQKRWTVALIEMWTDALRGASEFDPDLKKAVEDEVWQMQVKWPSVLRKEDATYQQMYMNRWNTNTISPRSFLEAMGEDPDDEIDRIRNAMTDPTEAALMSRMLGQVAGVMINKSLGLPPQGYVMPRLQLRGELPPQEVGNIANFYNWDQGPYGSAIGPQGAAGTAANTNYINSGMLNGNPYDGGTGTYPGPNQQPGVGSTPQLTPDQNTGQQPVSQPGSGATGVSMQGRLNQVAQQGK